MIIKNVNILKVCFAVVTFIVLELGISVDSYSQIQEYDLKAILLERFTQYLEWPENSNMSDASAPFIIGVVGDDPFDGTLETTYSDLKIKNKNVVIKYFDSFRGTQICNLVFISSSMKNNIDSIVNYFSDKPILLVSDVKGFGEKGVLINIFLENNYPKYELHEKKMEALGFKINFRLKRSASIIHDGGNR